MWKLLEPRSTAAIGLAEPLVARPAALGVTGSPLLAWGFGRRDRGDAGYGRGRTQARAEYSDPSDADAAIAGDLGAESDRAPRRPRARDATSSSPRRFEASPPPQRRRAAALPIHAARARSCDSRPRRVHHSPRFPGRRRPRHRRADHPRRRARGGARSAPRPAAHPQPARPAARRLHARRDRAPAHRPALARRALGSSARSRAPDRAAGGDARGVARSGSRSASTLCSLLVRRDRDQARRGVAQGPGLRSLRSSRGRLGAPRVVVRAADAGERRHQTARQRPAVPAADQPIATVAAEAIDRAWRRLLRHGKKLSDVERGRGLP